MVESSLGMDDRDVGENYERDAEENMASPGLQVAVVVSACLMAVGGAV
jgi:hypothetical protein